MRLCPSPPRLKIKDCFQLFDRFMLMPGRMRDINSLIRSYFPCWCSLLSLVFISGCSRHGPDLGKAASPEEQVILDYRNGWFHAANGSETIERIAWIYKRDPVLVAKLNRHGEKNRPVRDRQIYIPPSNKMDQLFTVLKRIRENPECVPTKPWNPGIMLAGGEASGKRPNKAPRKRLKVRVSDRILIDQEPGAIFVAGAGSIPPPRKASRPGLGGIHKSKKSSSRKTPGKRGPGVSGYVVPRDTFDWPASGQVVTQFQDGWRNACHGIEIAADEGSAVNAARSGRVLMAEEFLSYGKLIVIDHGDGYASAYGYNKELLVRPGQHVRKGARIARVGRQKSWSDSMLFFQIRRNASPVDPMVYLN